MGEMFQLTSKKDPNGIEGYRVAKTLNYYRNDFTFPKSKRSDPISEAKSRAKEPDPTAYSETPEIATKRYWKKPNGKFFKAKRLTIIDDIRKKASGTPGPGEYYRSSSLTPRTTPTKSVKRQIANEVNEKPSYLTTTEFYSGETPCSWNYTPKDIPDKFKKGWRKPKPLEKSKPKKENNGPGQFTDGLQKGYKLTMSSSTSHSFCKSNSPCPLYSRALATKDNPAVGSYKDLEKAYTKHQVIKRERTAIILPYKYKGFADDLIKTAKQSPGPGAYNVGRPAKIY